MPLYKVEYESNFRWNVVEPRQFWGNDPYAKNEAFKYASDLSDERYGYVNVFENSDLIAVFKDGEECQ